MTQTQYQGSFSLQGQGIKGLVHKTDLEQPVWVEILADGFSLGTVRADLPEENGYGFWLSLPTTVLEEGSTIQVRVANTENYIGETLHLSNEDDSATETGFIGSTLLRGELNCDRGLTLSGWVMDTLEPEKILYVRALLEGQIIAEASAGGRRYRPEHGDRHGFVLSLPVHLADGEEHLIAVQDEKGRTVPGSPVLIRLLPESVADWLESLGKIDTAEKKLLVNLLRQMEKRLPCALYDYESWKRAFPVSKLTVRGKFALSVLLWDQEKQIFEEADADLFLRGQQGVNLRNKVKKAEADYVLLLQKGESLLSGALAHLLNAQLASGRDLFYADGENLENSPLFKPCWDREFFWSHDYLGPLLLSAKLLRACQPQDNEDYSAFRVRLLQVAEQNKGIGHLPLILFREKPVKQTQARCEAIRKIIETTCPGTQVLCESEDRPVQIRYALQRKPLVSIIIPTRDHASLLRSCLASLVKTAYNPCEIIVVDNGSVEPEALALLAEAAQTPNVRVLKRPGVFNFAGINNFASREAQGELLCFLNNDTEALTTDWLSVMVALLLAQGDEAGCVGAKLLWPNGLVQHGGVVVGTHQLASHIGNQWLENEDGYMQRNFCVRQCSAVTAACLLTPKDVFTQLGGFDPIRFPVNFNDVDYCLRVRVAGRKILWTPLARLLHKESASRGQDESAMDKARCLQEMRLFRQRWGDYEDVFYNPNLPLSTVSEPFDGLALPPRSRRAN